MDRQLVNFAPSTPAGNSWHGPMGSSQAETHTEQERTKEDKARHILGTRTGSIPPGRHLPGYIVGTLGEESMARLKHANGHQDL